jgi:hypothetical protein
MVSIMFPPHYWVIEYCLLFQILPVVHETFENQVDYFLWFSEPMAFFGTFLVCLKVLKAKSTIIFGFPNTWPFLALFGVSEIFKSQINYMQGAA